MLGFDLIVLITSIFLFSFTKRNFVATVIVLQILSQFLFDIIYFDLQLGLLVTSFWFYFIKSYIFFLAIIALYKIGNCKKLIFLYFTIMLYYDGLLYEEHYVKGFFDTNFQSFMITTALLQLFFICGRIQKVRDIYGKCRTFVSNTISDIFYKCLRNFAVQDSGAQR